MVHKMSCSAVLVSGERKGNVCRKPVKNNGMCATHAKKHSEKYLDKLVEQSAISCLAAMKLEEKKPLFTSGCSSILKTGKNKGQLCGKAIKTDGKCTIHLAKPKEDEAKAPSETKKSKQKISKVLKMQVWDKYVGKSVASILCPNCNIIEIRMDAFEAGHVQPESKGGLATVENLRPICGTCNKSIGSKLMDTTKFKYSTKEPTKVDLESVYSSLSILQKAGLLS